MDAELKAPLAPPRHPSPRPIPKADLPDGSPEAATIGRNETIRSEAEEWRRQGRVDDKFLEWVRQQYPAGRDQGTERYLQQILLAFAAILAVIGIFFLVAEYWHYFSDVQKLWILRLFAVMAIALGVGLYQTRRARLLAHVALPLAIPLYIFSMAYADPELVEFQIRGQDRVDLQEASSLVLGVVGMVTALLVGLRRFPSLALGSTPGLVGVLMFLPHYVELGESGIRTFHWCMLTLVLLVHALLLMAWLGALPIPYAWDPQSLRLALFANVPWGFVFIIMLVNEYHWTQAYTVARYDETIVGVALTAAYVAILLGFGLRLGLPELTGISAAFLVADAIWLGADKGDVLGAVLAILGTAVLLGVLAQRGLLRRIFRPREPPTAGSRASRPT